MDDDFPTPHLDPEDDPNFVETPRVVEGSTDFKISEIDNGWILTIIMPGKPWVEQYYPDKISVVIALLETVNTYGKKVKTELEEPF